MKKYEYILLDWDGNLAKTLDIWLEAFRVPLVKRGFDKSDEEIGASFGAFTTFMQELKVEDPESVYEEADAIARKLLPNVELYPDAIEVLESLHGNGNKLALITTSPRINVMHLLEKYDLIKYFDAIITHDEVEHHKPHPEPLEKALSALGGTKELAVMIGDSDKDLGAANNFGIDSILFFPDEHRKFYDVEKLKQLHPTYVIDDFREVLKIAKQGSN